MQKNLWALDLNILKMMYEKEAMSLKNALLSGSSWEDVRDQRRKVTEISIAIHKLRHNSNNPAETSSRQDNPDSSEV
jgi:hypothetical protein